MAIFAYSHFIKILVATSAYSNLSNHNNSILQDIKTSRLNHLAPLASRSGTRSLNRMLTTSKGSRNLSLSDLESCKINLPLEDTPILLSNKKNQDKNTEDVYNLCICNPLAVIPEEITKKITGKRSNSVFSGNYPNKKIDLQDKYTYFNQLY